VSPRWRSMKFSQKESSHAVSRKSGLDDGFSRRLVNDPFVFSFSRRAVLDPFFATSLWSDKIVVTHALRGERRHKNYLRHKNLDHEVDRCMACNARTTKARQQSLGCNDPGNDSSFMIHVHSGLKEYLLFGLNAMQ